MQGRLALAVVIAAAAPRAARPQDADRCGLVPLDRLPGLPALHAVHQFSSHNRKGLNGDAGWRLYDDENGDAVIFDVEGPGCIRSMWGTDIHEDSIFRFFFDGDEKPRYEIPILDFYRGAHPLFPRPLVSYELRGRWGEKPYAGNSFVPIPFAKGLRIAVRGPLQFYHILFQRFPYGTEISTFTGAEDRRYLLDAFAGLDAPPAGAEERVVQAERIEGRKVLSLLEREGAGCIRRIAIEGEATDAFIRDVWIEMTWDGHAVCDVSSPLGFFFGSAVHPAPVRTLPVRIEMVAEGRIRLVSRFPMPFWASASVRLVNRSARAMGPIRAEISIGPQEFPRERAGYFTTCFRRGTTTYGRDWLLFESPGAGWFLGAVQSMQGDHYCEGDEHFWIDGAVSPQIHGTGTEDYYLGCLWPNRRYESPFAACAGDIQEEGGGTVAGAYGVPSAYARFHLEAPIPFFGRIDARIQHGGFNTISSRYASLGFAYVRPLPALVPTDFIDVGSAASESAHAYEAPSSRPYGPIAASPEGEWLRTEIRDEGRIHDGGEIAFTIAVHPGNRGVRIRRRLDQGIGRQTADVFIDGEFAGVWYHPDRNEHLRWFDSDHDIRETLTAGKDRLKVRLAVRAGKGRGSFTDFRYEVFSLLP